MNAKLDFNLSYIWRSLLLERHVLKGGLRWRIGNGDMVLTKCDCWIPRQFSFKLFHHNCSLPIDFKVGYLIDWSSLLWKHKMCIK